jgi:hypothetical protein
MAYFYTWTTYGTWLPGDSRGWFKRGAGFQAPNPIFELDAILDKAEDALTFNQQQRQIVENTIRQHCQIRNWLLHAVNCRTNHVHAVVTCNRKIQEPRIQFKAWCTRRLKEKEPALKSRDNLWTDRGWDLFVDDDECLGRVVAYVLEGQ